MGPLVSADFYKKIITLAQKKYGATQDTDFPPMFIYSLPLVGFDETGFVNPKLVEKQLINGVKKLEQAGSDFIVITCNTVHYFYQKMQAAVQILIISIITETINEVLKKKQKCVGVLSSESTNKLRLYEKALIENNIKVVSPNSKEQKMINKIILKIMSNNHGLTEKRKLKKIISRMRALGAQSIVLGCTELPLLLNQKDIDIPLFDSNNILAETTLKFAFGK